MCHGCMYLTYAARAGNGACPFCRKPIIVDSHDEFHRRYTKRMEAGDADAFMTMGGWYILGKHGLPQDRDRGLELYSQAAELGSATAHYNIAHSYVSGENVPRNAKKALFHNQQAAMRGNIQARHHLGCAEIVLGNSDRAIKHWMIAAASGKEESLDKIKLLFTQGSATKAQYERALRAYQHYQDEVQSDQRTKAIEFLNRQIAK